MKCGAQTLAQWGCEANQLVGELVEGMAQAIAQTSPRKQGLHTAGGAVEAIGEGALHLVCRLHLKGRALKVAIGLGKGGGAFGRTVPQMPDHPTTDDRGQEDRHSVTRAEYFICTA